MNAQPFYIASLILIYALVFGTLFYSCAHLPSVGY